MNPFFRQTRVRLALAYAVVFGVVALFAALAVWLALARAEYSAIDESLAAEARSIQLTLSANGAGPGGALPEPAAGLPIAALLFTADGALLETSGAAPQPAALVPVALRAASTGSNVVETLNIGGVSERVEALRFTGADGVARVLVVTRSTAEADQFLSTAAVVVLAGIAVLIVAATVIGYGLAGTALRPVREIAAAARSFSDLDLSRRINMDLPPDELGDLARTFNAMLARLELAFDSLRRFTADAAHELRAPLTLIRTEAEVSLRRARSAEEYQASLSTVLAEAERLSRLAEQLLLLAQADAGALKPRMTTIDLSRVAEDALALWGQVAEARGLSLTSRLEPGAAVVGDADLLRRVVDNLIDNALRHSPDGGEVEVSCRHGDKAWELVVADQGPGVPPPLRASVFERFTRGDPARQRETGGAGLGLALCAAIARLHKGSIALDETTTRGARFVVTLPEAPYRSEPTGVGLELEELATVPTPKPAGG